MASVVERHFESGEVILHRMPFVVESGVLPPQICDVKPMVVVEDGPELISLFLPAGTPTKLSVPLTRGQRRPWFDGESKLVDSTWSRWNALFLIVPGEWRATWAWWTPDWDFLGWYVNLQEPIRRTPVGFDVRDLQLDLLVDPARHWQWKDELESSVETGVISTAVAERTRAEGIAAIADVEAGAWPFTAEMNAWRPDEGWPAPTLPKVRLEGLLHLYDAEHWSDPKRL